MTPDDDLRSNRSIGIAQQSTNTCVISSQSGRRPTPSLHASPSHFGFRLGLLSMSLLLNI